SGVSRSRLDDQAARFQAPRALGRLDHRQSDAILDRSTGIEELGFGVDRRANAPRDLVDPDQWGPADRLEDVGVRLSVLWHSCPGAPWSYQRVDGSYQLARGEPESCLPAWCRAERPADEVWGARVAARPPVREAASGQGQVAESPCPCASSL